VSVTHIIMFYQDCVVGGGFACLNWLEQK